MKRDCKKFEEGGCQFKNDGKVLFGCDSGGAIVWGGYNLRKLQSFHNRTLRYMTGNHIRKIRMGIGNILTTRT